MASQSHDIRIMIMHTSQSPIIMHIQMLKRKSYNRDVQQDNILMTRRYLLKRTKSRSIFLIME